MNKQTNPQTQVDIEREDVRSKRCQARDQLWHWLKNLDAPTLRIVSDDDVQAHARHLITLVRLMHSQSSSAAHRRFLEIAAAIDDRIGLIDHSEKHMKKLVDRMNQAAALEVDLDCPWAHLRKELEYKPGQLAVANAFWDFNGDLASEWAIPLADFAQRVWGHDEKKTGSIRSAVSKFKLFLKSREINLDVSVHDGHGTHRIDCRLIS